MNKLKHIESKLSRRAFIKGGFAAAGGFIFFKKGIAWGNVMKDGLVGKSIFDVFEKAPKTAEEYVKNGGKETYFKKLAKEYNALYGANAVWDSEMSYGLGPPHLFLKMTCDTWGYDEQLSLGLKGEGGVFTKQNRATFNEAFWYENGKKFWQRKLILTPDPYFGEVWTGRNSDGKYKYLYIRNVVTEARGGAGPNTMNTVTFGKPVDDIKLKLGEDKKSVVVYKRIGDLFGRVVHDLEFGNERAPTDLLPKEEGVKLFAKPKGK